MPIPNNIRSLKRSLGLFAYYARWIPKFSDRVQPLKAVNDFPLDGATQKDFQNLKGAIAAAALSSIDENSPFVVECDASDVAISATLNQSGRPVTFVSRILQGSERFYPAIQKKLQQLSKLCVNGRLFSTLTRYSCYGPEIRDVYVRQQKTIQN